MRPDYSTTILVVEQKRKKLERSVAATVVAASLFVFCFKP
jgi:hypothetical protein